MLFYLLLLIFNVWYPVLGLFAIIIANLILREIERTKLESMYDVALTDDTSIFSMTNGENYNHLWIPPLAASLVGCISMLFFNFFSTGIIMDIIDTCFLCFAIDADNNIDLSGSDLNALISDMPGYEPKSPVCGEEDIEKVWKGENKTRGERTVYSGHSSASSLDSYVTK